MNSHKKIIVFKLIVCLISITGTGCSQNDYTVETTDIKNFWIAYDQLKTVNSKEDSIKVIQRLYIDKASSYFKKFIEAKNFTATEYVEIIRRYPKFWKSIRPLTMDIENRLPEIEEIFVEYRKVLPKFKQPNICFAIGCLRTGGTISKNLVLIGSEIAAANHTTDKSEMNGRLSRVIGNTGNITSMIAHETIHTQQFDSRLLVGSKNRLLEQTLKEGIADFFSSEFLGLNINKGLFEYGKKHECELKQEFLKDLKNYPNEYSRWMYQENSSKAKPADLGYFIGYKIAKMYYEKANNKKKAIRNLLNAKLYRKIFKESNFVNENCD